MKKHRCFSARLPPDEDPAVESGRVMRSVEVGEEVLARWSDEGWYYRGNTNFGRILWHDMYVFGCARACSLGARLSRMRNSNSNFVNTSLNFKP